LNFRFNGADLRRILAELNFPQNIKLDNEYLVTGEEVLLISLRRLAYPARLSDLEPMLRKSSTFISRAFLFGVRFIKRVHFDKLSTLENFRGHFARLGQAVAAKGCPIANVIGFIDGTPRKISRPSIRQGLYYSGHKRIHCLKFQSIMLPNGLIGIMDGPYFGSRHDAGILRDSGLDDVLGVQLLVGQTQYYLYGDLGYPIREYLMSPFDGAWLTNEQQEFNSLMSSLRISVEWGFSKIIAIFSFLDFSKNLKLLLQEVGDFYVVVTFFTNVHTCCYGSQTSSYFNCNPPTLEDYIRRREYMIVYNNN